MTKDTDEFSQFSEPVTCREYTLPRDEKSTDPKGWIRGNTNIGPVLEVTTSYLQGKYGVEIRIESVNKDNSHSWVRISHGLNKLVTDVIDKEYDDNEQETSETNTEAFALKTNVLAFASRPKAKTRSWRPSTTCSSTRTVPVCERIWTHIEPGTQSNLAYPVAERLNTLLRHGQLRKKKMVRWNSGDWKMIFGTNLSTLNIGLTMYGRAKMQGGGGNKKRFQYCIDSSGQEILYLRALQGHSGRNPIDPHTPGQSVNSGQFLRVHFSYWMCHQFTLHKFRIDTGRTKFKQGKTDSVLYSCESHGQGTRRSVQAWLDQTTSCMVQAKVDKAPGYGVLGRYTACSTERIEILSNQIEHNHPLRYTPSLLYLKSCCDGNWRSLIRESICVTSTTTDGFIQR